MQNFRFNGAVSIVSAVSAATLGLAVALHWRASGLPRSLEVHWTRPSATTTMVAEILPPWSLLSASKAPMVAPLEPGWWSVQVVLKQSTGHGNGPVIGARQFFVFNDPHPVPIEAFK